MLYLSVGKSLSPNAGEKAVKIACNFADFFQTDLRVICGHGGSE